MSVQGGVSENSDKSKNYSLGIVKSNNEHALSANAFVNGYKETGKGNNYKTAGGSIGYENAGGHAASLTAQHIPSFGNQLTAAAKVNVLSSDNHKVDVNAFSTMNMPKAPIPNFGTHGAGVDYQFKDKFGASASMTNTPMFQQKDYSVAGRMNLHQTPTSSLDLNVGASKSVSPFSNGNWQPGVFMGFKKTF